MQTHGHLAIRGFAQRARVLTRDADRMLAFFREAGVIDDPSHGVREGTLDTFRRPLPEGLPSPRTLANKLLQVLLVAIRQALGHGADAFPFAVQQQTTNIDTAPMAGSLRPSGASISAMNAC